MKRRFSFRRAINFGCIEYNSWIFNPRGIILIIEIIFIWSFAIDGVKLIISTMNSPINIAEPVLAVFNSQALALVIPAVFFVLISDIPLTGNGDLFFIHRISRKEWLVGQLWFYLLATISYNLIILIISLIPVIKDTVVNNEWSEAVTRYAAYNPNKASSFEAGLINNRLYTQIAPLSALMHSVLLSAAFVFSIPVMLLLFYSFKAGKVGIGVTACFIGVGAALCFAGIKEMWLFPSAHTLLYLHYNSYIKKMNMKLEYSYLYFVILNTVMILLLFLRVGKLDLLKSEEG